MIGRVVTAALVLCALAAAASDVPAPERTRTAHPERVAAVAVDSRALSSHAVVVASALQVPPVWFQAMPPPPKTVTLESKMYGTVSFDHPAHLARRVACRECHGPGPARKIEFTPAIGHDRCRGCHVKIARGPTQCNGCHAVTPKDAVLAKAEPEPEPVAVLLPAPPTPTEALAALAPAEEPPSFRRTFEFGVTSLASHAGVLYGPAVGLGGHYGDTLLNYTLSIAGGVERGRGQLLVGGGREWTVTPRLRWSALGVAGLDATFDTSAVLPAAGARLGLERSLPLPGIRSVALDFTALMDLMSNESAGRHAGDMSFGFTLSAGLPLSR